VLLTRCGNDEVLSVFKRVRKLVCRRARRMRRSKRSRRHDRPMLLLLAFAMTF
jgi:hypothetical protein